MSYTEVTEEGWFSRIGSSIKGIFFGILLFALGFPVLFWNEGRAVRRAQSLAEGRGAVISVQADKVDEANEGELVHLWGLATTEGTLSDPEFGVSADNAIRFERVVEMYQWDEEVETRTEKKAGGKKKTIKTYTYHKVWSSNAIDSSSFKESGHSNPGSLPYSGNTLYADKITLGAFELGNSLAAKIGGEEDLPLTGNPKGSLTSQFKINGNNFYRGSDPSNPQIGDVKVTFYAIPPATVSVIAVQNGNSFAPYTAEAGGSTIFELKHGEVTADEMFTQLESDNTKLTWILRLVGFLMIMFGINMVLSPLVVVADVLPFFGSLIETGVGLIAFTTALPLTLVTIAVGWIAYRPILGGILIAVALGVFVMGLKMAKARKSG